MKSLENINLELKKAEDYLDAMVRAKTANKEDCENVKMHLDNINSIVRVLSIPDVSVTCTNCIYCVDNGAVKNHNEKYTCLIDNLNIVEPENYKCEHYKKHEK